MVNFRAPLVVRQLGTWRGEAQAAQCHFWNHSVNSEVRTIGAPLLIIFAELPEFSHLIQLCSRLSLGLIPLLEDFEIPEFNIPTDLQAQISRHSPGKSTESVYNVGLALHPFFMPPRHLPTTMMKSPHSASLSAQAMAS